MFWHIFVVTFSAAAAMMVTAVFADHPPLLLLISLDGFRYDLLNRSTTPNLYRLADRGVRFANGVRPQYTTFTAPNHASIATGLLQQHHGIVGNSFYDRDTGLL